MAAVRLTNAEWKHRALAAELEAERLRADRDRWRARASVTDDDCARAGITWEHVDAFCAQVFPDWVGNRRMDMASMIGRPWCDRCPQDNLALCAAILDPAPEASP